MLPHRPQRCHVDLVNVRPFFPIDLDIDVVGIHQVGNVGIFEAFVRHDVAPVTGGVANGKQNGFARIARLRQRKFSPWPPVHWIASVLPEIGTGLVSKEIGLLIHWIALLFPNAGMRVIKVIQCSRG